MTSDQREAVRDWLIDAIQRVGFPIVMCSAFAWACYGMVRWEREEMMVALQNSAKVINENSEALKSVKTSLDRLDKSTRTRIDQENR